MHVLDTNEPWCGECNAELEEDCVCGSPEALVYAGEPAMTVLQMADLARSLLHECAEGVDDELYQRIQGFSRAEGRKVEACYHVVRRLENEVEFLNEEASRLRQRASRLQKQARRVRDTVTELVLASEPLRDSRTVKTPTVTATAIVSQAVEGPEDVYGWPEEYLRPQPPKPDRAKAKRDLKRGADIPGVRLVDRPYVRFT